MKKLIIFFFLFLSSSAFAQLDTINNGSAPGDGNGEKLFYAFQKVNKAIKMIDSNSARLDTISIDSVAYSDTSNYSNYSDTSTWFLSGNYTDLVNIPATFTPESHTQDISTINSLTGTLNSKQDTTSRYIGLTLVESDTIKSTVSIMGNDTVTGSLKFSEVWRIFEADTITTSFTWIITTNDSTWIERPKGTFSERIE